MKNKLIVILGPTASGKSDLAVTLARRFSGQIISADSRQVYKGLDIGSGKITKKEMEGIPHHVLDVANPKHKFTVTQFQKLALKAIKKIHAAGDTPFLVGGTGFYIQSIVDGLVIPEVKPNEALRKKLSRLNMEKLYEMLKKLDPVRASSIDAKNPVRLIRAIEIVKATKKPIEPVKKSSQFNVLQVGIKKSSKQLEKLIALRLQKRLMGMVKEVKQLHAKGLSFKRMEELGLEYRFVAQYVQSRISLRQMQESIQKESVQYTKRQMTWFKRDKKIYWIATQKQAESLIKKFLK